MLYRAFKASNRDNNYEVCLYPNPIRWKDNFVGEGNPIRNINNWSSEIKYIVDGKLSDEIRNTPKDTGGIDMFYLKGINLPFSEYYILYIGRARLTDTENINKRACHYIYDDRELIKEMFSRWKDQLYYRYYADTENDRIDRNEVLLIRSIFPPYNEQIPDKLDPQIEVKAF